MVLNINTYLIVYGLTHEKNTNQQGQDFDNFQLT